MTTIAFHRLQNPQSIYEEIDAVRFHHNFGEVERRLAPHIGPNCVDRELLWRQVRSFSDIATEEQDKNKRKQLVQQGFDLAERLRSLHPDFFAAHLWWGIMLSKMSEFISKMEKGPTVKHSKEAFDKAYALNPEDPTVQHVLANWCYQIASLSALERKLLQAGFGVKTPTFEEALRFALVTDQGAQRIQIPFPDNTLLMGQIYTKLQQYDKARQCYAEVASLSPNTTKRHRLASEAKKQLASLPTR